MSTVAHYKKHWDKMSARDKISREEKRRHALRVAGKLRDILAREFKVTRIVLFGSVLDKRCFDAVSDIDIAVEGLAKGAYFAAVARLMMESPFSVDLKPIEDASVLLRQRIERGKVLYEKRTHS